MEKRLEALTLHCKESHHFTGEMRDRGEGEEGNNQQKVMRPLRSNATLPWRGDALHEGLPSSGALPIDAPLDGSDVKRLKLLNDSELGRVLGHSLSIDEALLERDRQAAAPGVADWDPTRFAYGLILGDGYINRYGAITLRHSWRQKGYLVWKHLMCSRFGYLTEKSTPVRVVNYHIGSRKFYVSYRFNTKSCFKDLRASFYPAGAISRPKGRRKALPADFRERLDEGILALWLMDDGGRGGNSAEGVVIDLSSFTSPEHATIQQALLDRFQLETSLHHHNRQRGHVKLFFGKSSVGRLKELVRPYMIPSQRYKIHE